MRHHVSVIMEYSVCVRAALQLDNRHVIRRYQTSVPSNNMTVAGQEGSTKVNTGSTLCPLERVSNNKVIFKHGIVATIVHLEAIGVVKDIVMNVKPTAPVIVIDALRGPIRRKNQIAGDRSPDRYKAG